MLAIIIHSTTLIKPKPEIKELGKLPENVTNQPKPEGFYQQDGNTWAEDVETKNEAQSQQNIAFLSYENKRVNTAILTLDDAVEFKIATDEEIALHKELRKYRVLLTTNKQDK